MLYTKLKILTNINQIWSVGIHLKAWQKTLGISKLFWVSFFPYLINDFTRTIKARNLEIGILVTPHTYELVLHYKNILKG